MTDSEAIQAAMERVRRSAERTIKRALVIPQEPSPLPASDDPMYGFLREQHRVIARLRGRPCGCGTCDSQGNG